MKIIHHFSKLFTSLLNHLYRDDAHLCTEEVQSRVDRSAPHKLIEHAHEANLACGLDALALAGQGGVRAPVLEVAERFRDVVAELTVDEPAANHEARPALPALAVNSDNISFVQREVVVHPLTEIYDRLQRRNTMVIHRNMIEPISEARCAILRLAQIDDHVVPGM